MMKIHKNKEKKKWKIGKEDKKSKEEIYNGNGRPNIQGGVL